jgi:hypothetical protein
MLQPPVSVVDDVDLRLVVPGDEGLLLTATLRYEASDPYAVEATFRAGDEASAARGTCGSGRRWRMRARSSCCS